MAKITPELKQVSEHVYICMADADTRAVMGAKTSRVRDFETRWDSDRLAVEHTWGDAADDFKTFLRQNLAGYGHASIAEMAELFVHVKNVGWPMAWLLEDYPLFRGQEVSTRAINMAKSGRMCLGAPESLRPLHEQWLAVFNELNETIVAGGGYKFDQIRWALPGTLPAGVTMTGDVRSVVRHLEQIEGMGDAYAEIAQLLLEGAAAYAPETVGAARKGPRKPELDWAETRSKYMRPDQRDADGAYVSCLYRCNRDIRACRPRTAVEHLDRRWAHVGLFQFEVFCSVAAARDWHRHRAVMPWTLEVPTGSLRRASAKYYPMLHDSKYDELWDATESAYQELARSAQPWEALYALPFGAMIKLTCTATLPALLYMLELRASASGANFEYKDQAIQGLIQLRDAAGPQITNAAGLSLVLDSLK